MTSTNVFLQYKGTDICLDFRCECGFTGHFDGYFASQIQCPDCKKIFVMPDSLDLRERTADDYQHKPVVPEDDDDEAEDVPT